MGSAGLLAGCRAGLPARTSPHARISSVQPVRHPMDQEPCAATPVYHPSDVDLSLGSPVENRRNDRDPFGSALSHRTVTPGTSHAPRSGSKFHPDPLRGGGSILSVYPNRTQLTQRRAALLRCPPFSFEFSLPRTRSKQGSTQPLPATRPPGRDDARCRPPSCAGNS